MSALSQLNMLDASELVWPLTFRYVAQGGRGWTSWEISVDAPGLNGLHDESVALGSQLWASSIATAITSSVDLVYFDYVIHKVAPLPSISGGGGYSGRLSGTPAPRDKSCCISFNTEHMDSYGRRRHYLYGMPFNWQDGQLLTPRGWDGAMQYAFLLAMGLSASYSGGTLQHLIAYWNVVPSTLDNLLGVGFRRVASYNVFQYVEKAPDLSDSLWPPTAP